MTKYDPKDRADLSIVDEMLEFDEPTDSRFYSFLHYNAKTRSYNLSISGMQRLRILLKELPRDVKKAEV